MYQIVATDDFISVMKDIPLKYAGVLTNSFIAITKIPDIDIQDQDFISVLLSQMKNQELE